MKSILMISLLMASLNTMAATPIDETRHFTPGKLLEVENIKGSISISTWDEDKIELTGKLGDGSEELEIIETSSRLSIKVRLPRGNNRSEASHLVLKVPANIELDLQGVSADISVENTRGLIRAESVSGDIRLNNTEGEIDIESVSGDLIMDLTSSMSSAETVSGDIELKGASGEVRVQTVSGDQELMLGELVRGKMESVSGDIELEIAEIVSGRLNLESMSGDVDLRLEKSSSATIEAKTFSGNLKSRFDGARLSRKTMDLVIGKGSADIRLQSFSGDINVSPK